MTATSQARGHKNQAAVAVEARSWQQSLMRFLPAWIILAMVLSILLPNVLTMTFGAAARAVTGTVMGGNTIVGTILGGGAATSSSIAPLFTSEVDYWANDIGRWAAQYGLDPNLLATVMQIESCGQAEVSSHAGAQGLFQVMPFHFAQGEVYTDPDTNARRSANFLNECLGYANGDPGLALACYNGGPSVTMRPFDTWPNETQRYYVWGTGIYNDARNNMSESGTLTDWLGAGGVNLCTSAAATQVAQ